MAKILTADDSASIRQMVSQALSDAGHQVVTANDGQEALGLAEKQSFDLIVSDINMPRLDGIGLVKAIRKLSAYRFTPILILTTENSNEKKAEGKSCGATGWLVKPFNPDTLLQTINRVI